MRHTLRSAIVALLLASGAISTASAQDKPVVDRPANNSTVFVGRPEVSGRAQPGEKVTIFIGDAQFPGNEAAVGTADADAEGAFSMVDYDINPNFNAGDKRKYRVFARVQRDGKNVDSSLNTFEAIICGVVPGQDSNGNGTPDEVEGPQGDQNNNGVPDYLETPQATPVRPGGYSGGAGPSNCSIASAPGSEPPRSDSTILLVAVFGALAGVFVGRRRVR